MFQINEQELEHLLKLTCALYKATDSFSEQEPLRFFIRKGALDVLADSALLFSKNFLFLNKEQRKELSENVLKNIKIVNAGCQVAQRQDCVIGSYFALFVKEYGNLAVKMKEKESLDSSIIKQTAESADSDQLKHSTKNSRQNNKKQNNNNLKQFDLKQLKKERHKKIIKILEKKQTAQIRNFKEVFPELTKRTLRRDMDYLLRLGLVKRKGDANNTLYVLNDKVVRT